jgi:D-tyrosyl-tRNA(Tyr) deacylase
MLPSVFPARPEGTTGARSGSWSNRFDATRIIDAISSERFVRVLIQRVLQASVRVGDAVRGEVDRGLLLLVGLRADDTVEDFEWVARKVVNLRVFNDERAVMNRSVVDVGGGILAVSQFTLYASTAKGNRPSYSGAAPAAMAEPLFRHFVAVLETALGKPVATGVFGADMQVALVNDGPVTIWLDSRSRE